MNIAWLILRIPSYCLRLLPVAMRLALGRGLGRVWFHLIRFRRSVVLANLRIALGSELGEKELLRIARTNFEHYGVTIVECLVAMGWRPEDFARAAPVEGASHLHDALRLGKGAIILSGHLGNWEMVLGSSAGLGVPVHAVVKQTAHPWMTQLLRRFREGSGIRLIYESGTAREILTALRAGETVVFVIDQFMGPPIGLPVTFFGRVAGTAAAAALLSDKSGAPLVPGYGYREEGRHHVIFERPLDLTNLPETREARLYAITQRINDALERQVRAHPDQWLWLHRRWKEFRGAPRWLPTAASALFLALLASCAFYKPAETGIAVPPDPEVSVPRIVEVTAPASGDSEGVRVVVQGPVPPLLVQTPKRKRKDKSADAASPTAQIAQMPALVVHNVDKMPFGVGERTDYELNWMALPAGKVRIEVRQGPVLNARPTLWLWANILSSRIVDAIYHVDNTIETYVDASALLPYRFLLHMVETTQLKETRVTFDHVKNKAHYWAKRISKRWGDEEQNRVDDLAPMARDMFSALFFTRTLPFRLGEKLTVRVYENKSNLDVDLQPVANEMLRTPAGIFQCWKVQVWLKVNNVLQPMGDTFMWLSDDSKKHLVRFEVKLKFGALNGTLMAVREG